MGGSSFAFTPISPPALTVVPEWRIADVPGGAAGGLFSWFVMSLDLGALLSIVLAPLPMLSAARFLLVLLLPPPSLVKLPVRPPPPVTPLLALWDWSAA